MCIAPTKTNDTNYKLSSTTALCLKLNIKQSSHAGVATKNNGIVFWDFLKFDIFNPGFLYPHKKEVVEAFYVFVDKYSYSQMVSVFV